MTHDSFTVDRDAVIARAVAAGVTRQIITGADLPSSHAAADLAATAPATLWSTAGVHPHRATTFDSTVRAELQSLLSLPQVVAVGECGLDYHRNFSPPAVQRAVFAEQLELAASIGKPVFLHQRDAHADFMAILNEYSAGLRAGVAHCFTGSTAQLDDYLALGLYIGVTGWVCDERRGGELRQSVPRIPSARLMVETDAPYLLPRDLRPEPKGRRNEPALLPHVVRAIALLRNESFETLAAISTRTAIAFFGL